MLPNCYAESEFSVDSFQTLLYSLTVGDRAVIHDLSVEMSIELLHPVPEAIGSLLVYTEERRDQKHAHANYWGILTVGLVA